MQVLSLSFFTLSEISNETERRPGGGKGVEQAMSHARRRNGVEVGVTDFREGRVFGLNGNILICCYKFVLIIFLGVDSVLSTSSCFPQS